MVQPFGLSEPNTVEASEGLHKSIPLSWCNAAALVEQSALDTWQTLRPPDRPTALPNFSASVHYSMAETGGK